MKREVVDCDRCGKECSAHVCLAIPNGTESETCPAGGYSTTYHLYENKEICPDCAAKLLAFMFRMKKHIEVKDDCSDPYGCRTKTLVKWVDSRNTHPSAETNDAVALALKWFRIEPKE